MSEMVLTKGKLIALPMYFPTVPTQSSTLIWIRCQKGLPIQSSLISHSNSSSHANVICVSSWKIKWMLETAPFCAPYTYGVAGRPARGRKTEKKKKRLLRVKKTSKLSNYKTIIGIQEEPNKKAQCTVVRLVTRTRSKLGAADDSLILNQSFQYRIEKIISGHTDNFIHQFQ